MIESFALLLTSHQLMRTQLSLANKLLPYKQLYSVVLFLIDFSLSRKWLFLHMYPTKSTVTLNFGSNTKTIIMHLIEEESRISYWPEILTYYNNGRQISVAGPLNCFGNRDLQLRKDNQKRKW